MKLSVKQNQAVAAIMGFTKADGVKRFVLDGPAGSGKSTLVKYVSKQFDKVVHCAYTGKAANVLREKGNNGATTIHGACYTLEDPDAPEPSYVLDHDSVMTRADLVVIDEYSMLSQEIIEDIETLADKVLYLGDSFQLPPVNGTCILTPDFQLDEIHRQALESPILRAATDVREGRELKFCDDGDFVFGSRSKFCAEDYETADQIIVGYNNTRVAWNNRFREKMGFAGHVLPCAGDKLICLKNNHRVGLFNGMIGEASNDARQVSFQEINLDFEKHRNLKVWDGVFKGRKDQPVGRDKSLERFDYAYAITCHKSQGSEFDDVLIYNEPIGKDALEKRRWLYTAITRGKEKVKLVQPK